MNRPLIAACVCLITLIATFARADTPPNRWDTARDPDARERYALHVAVRELMLIPRQSRVPSFHDAPLVRARMMLEASKADQSPDPVLRFDLGEIYALLHEHGRAIAVLRSALAMAPDHPAALDAYVSLANAYAYLDRSGEERDTYESYLAHETNERRRANAMLNMAEAEMHLGNLTEAIAEYRETIQLASQLPNMIEFEDNTGVLAVWGLAVALDRSGDEAGGAAQARFALQLDPGARIINPRWNNNVFFVPEYERFWYLALGAAEYAKLAKSAHEQADRWSNVEAIWAAYVEHADAKDRWLAQAKAHYERARRTATERRKRAQATPPAFGREPHEPGQALPVPVVP